MTSLRDEREPGGDFVPPPYLFGRGAVLIVAGVLVGALVLAEMGGGEAGEADVDAAAERQEVFEELRRRIEEQRQVVRREESRGGGEAVVAQGGGVALASVCRDGEYGLFVSAAPAGRPWEDNPPASEETDRLAEGLRWGDTATEHQWSRVEGSAETWTIPNPRSHTRRLLILSAREELDLRIWLPGDDRTGPGRAVDVSRETAARMWLNVTRCLEAGP